jgi:hypothetical protein
MAMRSRSLPTLAMVVALIAALVHPAGVLAQVTDGATLTVLRGQVAVIHGDGSADQPAPSGTIVRAGDEIRTLNKTGALITFFTGTEIEMGEETILAVDRVSKQGTTVDISLKQVLGVTLNRVQSLSDPSSSYRIEAGGATAVVRGTTFALIGPVPTSQGNIVALVCLDDCDGRTSFNGCATSEYTALGVQVEKGKATSGCDVYSVGRNADYFNEAAQAITTFEQSAANGNGVSNPGNANLGHGNQQSAIESKRAEEQKEDNDTPTGFAGVVIPSPVSPIAPIGPGNFSGTCSNRTQGGSNCSVTGTNLTGGLVGGVPTFRTQTIASAGASPVNETFSCAPISSSLSSTCTFTTSGRLFQGSPGQLFYPLAGGGQGTSVILFFQCGLANGAVCPNVVP